MNKRYNLKLDLQFRCNNSTMKFNQFDNNTSDFFMRITNGGNLVDIEKAIVVLAIIKPSGKVASQFIEVENGLVYADLKPSMIDEIGTYTAQAMLILEDERVVTDSISYEVEEDKIFSLLNDSAETSEEFTLLTDMLSRLSTIETNEEQRVINEAERILSEENRKTEEAKRVEAELIRQHEEADRTKYDAIRESNENIRKQNESIRLANEANRIDEEVKRVEEENKRKLAEEERNANYNFMTEDEERRRSEANAHKEAEVLRVQAETNRVNEEAKRRTTEQARVSAENTRVSNENARETNEEARQNNEAQRVEAETQRQNRYNSFISDAEKVANDFEAYTNSAKASEEERKASELDRKLQEDRRVSNEVERISNENTRKANEVIREENETCRQNTFANKISEVDEKIIELNTTKDNFVSGINTKVDNKISELDSAKSDMTNTVSNKVNEVENRFNALTSKQQQDAEVIDARDGETSLKARLDRDIEKAKQVYVNVEGSHISTDSSSGYAKDVEILGNTIQDASNLADIRSVGDKVEGQELYEIPIVSCGKNLFDGEFIDGKAINFTTGEYYDNNAMCASANFTSVSGNSNYYLNVSPYGWVIEYDANKKCIGGKQFWNKFTTSANCRYIKFYIGKDAKTDTIQLEEGTVATPYEPYQEDKLTILSPVQLERVGDVADRIIEKDGVWGVEKNVKTYRLPSVDSLANNQSQGNTNLFTLLTLPNAMFTGTSGNIMCTHYKEDINNWSSDVVGCKLYSNLNFNIRVLKTEIPDIQSMRDFLLKNNVSVKYPTTKPQFIPLPHDQQIKLRTFANKTNISFLTEIEGTIKAQVPKSLGATVNTHTEQISNLNKELDRVKKLEESTVSTVETENNFTTVEATSNGYFEDVKLEGRTLVVNSDNEVVESGTDGAMLKSVGEDVDEIVVSSVNENIFEYDSFVVYTGKLGIINKNKNMFGTIRCINNTDKVVLFLIHNKKTDAWIREKSVAGNGGVFETTLDINEYVKHITVTTNSGWDIESMDTVETVLKNTLITNSKTLNTYKPHQSDKKRLLYYNNETQAWEKPILRQWDSIEKHADGKYYYHKRSGEVVFDGSETIVNNTNQNKENTMFFEIKNIANNEKALSDKFITLTSGATDEEGIILNKQYSNISIRILKSKLATQDVQGFKQWLQANNVTVVYQLAQEKVYECTNIDLITYNGETNYVVNSGAIVPRSTLKVHNNISNVVSLLQKKVSLLEDTVTSYMITQNRLMLASRYNADNVTFKVDYPSMMSEREVEIDYDLFKLIQDNIIVGPENYDVDKMLEIMDLYAMIGFITWEMWDYLYEVIDSQINPVIEDLEGTPEI